MKSTLTRPLIVGHRGWPARFPDNTLAGLTASSAVSDLIEIDVRRSADGKLVLSHDPSILGHVVTATPWSVLAEIDLGDGHHPALLDEALAALPDTPLLMEIKNEPLQPGYEPDHRLALEAADRARPGDAVISFNWDSMKRVRSAYPELPTGLNVATADAILDAVGLCLDDGHGILVPNAAIDDSLLSQGVEAGIRVFPWTVNDPTRAGELAALGVSGIITNVPDLISEAL